jgi:phosphate transport system substrate-binding protein
LIGAALEQSFEATDPRFDLILQVDTDRNCVDRLMLGTAEVAVVASPLSRNELEFGLLEEQLGHIVVVPVVHPENPVFDLRRSVLSEILEGDLSSWKPLGGPDRKIQRSCLTVARTPDPPHDLLRFVGKAREGTLFMREERDILHLVRTDPDALGLVSTVSLHGAQGVRGLEVDGVTGTLSAYLSGAWSLGTTYRVIRRPASSPPAEAWLRFLAGPEAGAVLQRTLELDR